MGLGRNGMGPLIRSRSTGKDKNIWQSLEGVLGKMWLTLPVGVYWGADFIRRYLCLSEVCGMILAVIYKMD